MQNWKKLLLDPALKLENQRTILTPLLLSHVEDLAKIGLEEQIWTHNPHTACRSKEDIENYVKTALEKKKTFQRVPFAIFDKKYNKIAGSSSFYAISEQHRKLAIGYTWLGLEFQKTGLNSAIKSAQYQFAFETLQCIRVEFHTDSKNTASRNSILKHGCQLEGIIRNDIIKHDGVERDTATFSILKKEYQAKKQQLFIE